MELRPDLRRPLRRDEVLRGRLLAELYFAASGLTITWYSPWATAALICLGAFAVLFYSGIVTLILALILKYTIGLRVGVEEESTGIDEAEHAETSYDFGVVGGQGSVLPAARIPVDDRNGLDDRVADKVEAEQS